MDTDTASECVFDRIVKEQERRLITSVSRAEAFQLERKGLFPRRRRISNRSVGWLLSELLDWVKSREAVISKDSPGKAL
ncbi:AlpA family phage regulatory protein [Shewanella litorisediminis]|uniref:AlpA family phage regulatory protein n=1 Tax=Shewanella litorisediminis TaxID=1173586 RepID=A0ABX7G919_9GAMM|nr:AlpA family phage regulatory protein [Shewanella litorisediminis]MCL2918606.1 AlpA family transcriptional regulator [Shewanella litorisediminis]QRH03714.1 AlpA family phage regulatory protein [Shewanella litorisediminis]